MPGGGGGQDPVLPPMEVRGREVGRYLSERELAWLIVCRFKKGCVLYYTNSSSEIESTVLLQFNKTGRSCRAVLYRPCTSSRSFFFSGGAVGGGE